MVLVLAMALTAGPAAGRVASSATRKEPRARAAASNPFATRGMWIWILRDSNGGNLSSIIAKAHSRGIQTLYIKSSDGTSWFSQFNQNVVSTLEANGINVCAWQFVYGNRPSQEAQMGADAVNDGANCLVIDAEGQYEGKYSQAQTYMTQLRALIGTSFPVGLAGLPYIDYHPSFPYSIFLGPSGAQYNLPQMYWRDIGTSVNQVYAHTYFYNRLYTRPIDPLGQVWENPPTSQILRFRQLMAAYGASGISWWDWQEAPASSWSAISRYVGPLPNAAAVPGYPTLSRGAAGDLVVWAQEHLRAAGETLTVDGGFGKQTVAAVENFQTTHRLTADGLIGSQTWAALLRYKPVYVQWAKPSVTKAPRALSSRRVTAPAVAASDTPSAQAAIETPPGTTPVPASALLPAKANEIPGSLGAGRP